MEGEEKFLTRLQTFPRPATFPNALSLCFHVVLGVEGGGDGGDSGGGGDARER